MAQLGPINVEMDFGPRQRQRTGDVPIWCASEQIASMHFEAMPVVGDFIEVGDRVYEVIGRVHSSDHFSRVALRVVAL